VQHLFAVWTTLSAPLDFSRWYLSILVLFIALLNCGAGIFKHFYFLFIFAHPNCLLDFCFRLIILLIVFVRWNSQTFYVLYLTYTLTKNWGLDTNVSYSEISLYIALSVIFKVRWLGELSDKMHKLSFHLNGNCTSAGCRYRYKDTFSLAQVCGLSFPKMSLRCATFICRSAANFRFHFNATALSGKQFPS